MYRSLGKYISYKPFFFVWSFASYIRIFKNSYGDVTIADEGLHFFYNMGLLHHKNVRYDLVKLVHFYASLSCSGLTWGVLTPGILYLILSPSTM